MLQANKFPKIFLSLIGLQVCKLRVLLDYYRAVGRSKNPGVSVLFGGHNLPPLVEIGLIDLPIYVVAIAPPATPGPTGMEQGGRTSQQ